MLPKFLIADNSQELPNSVFVVHNEYPRCIIESDIEDFDKDQEVYWIDDTPKDIEMVSEMLQDAEDFLISELEHQDKLYDEDEE